MRSTPADRQSPHPVSLVDEVKALRKRMYFKRRGFRRGRKGTLTMDHVIPDAAVQRYAAAPSPATVSAVVSLHNTIRGVLGDGYETFLQGSYKNDTSIVDLNDVDIVAIRKATVSGAFSREAYDSRISWDRIFGEIEDRLEGSHHYAGKTERGDKCITVNTNFHADVVPAVRIGPIEQDPIAIFSFDECEERKNFPRDHFERNKEKQARTNDAYKATVRMFKRWVSNWFPETDIAPSFYVECLVHSVPDSEFSRDLAVSFFLVGYHIVDKVKPQTVVLSVAGDKDILVESEWDWNRFQQFSDQLTLSLGNVVKALKATTIQEATKEWKAAFRE